MDVGASKTDSTANNTPATENVAEGTRDFRTRTVSADTSYFVRQRFHAIHDAARRALSVHFSVVDRHIESAPTRDHPLAANDLHGHRPAVAQVSGFTLTTLA